MPRVFACDVKFKLKNVFTHNILPLSNKIRFQIQVNNTDGHNNVTFKGTKRPLEQSHVSLCGHSPQSSEA